MDFNSYRVRNGIGLIMIVIMICYILKKDRKSKRDAVSMNICGVVTEVKYSMQERPTFKINGKKYDSFRFKWNRDDHIEIGDTVLKNKGSLVLIVKKKRK